MKRLVLIAGEGVIECVGAAFDGRNVAESQDRTPLFSRLTRHCPGCSAKARKRLPVLALNLVLGRMIEAVWIPTPTNRMPLFGRRPGSAARSPVLAERLARIAPKTLTIRSNASAPSLRARCACLTDPEHSGRSARTAHHGRHTKPF